ncbi:MAG TPA: gamma-glutamyl-gamma-aminobutyrate hydrolase family protein [Thermoanaerobaculia bacterium]
MTIVLLAEYDASFPPHPATAAALAHSAAALGIEARGEWVSTRDVDEALLARASGLWVAPGSPYRDLPRTLDAIRYARERNLPILGTCGGFQHMVLEYARNVLGHRDAAHAEYDAYASWLFISTLACSLAGRTMRLSFTPGSRIASIYGATEADEEYYCNFGVSPEAVPLLASSALRISGGDDEGEVRVIELPEHRFYIGTLFVPQMRSRPDAPHPLVTAFVNVTSLAAK